MSESEQRYEALKLAQCLAHPGERPEQTIARAQEYLKFLLAIPAKPEGES